MALWTVFVASFIGFAVVILCMAVGVMLGRRSIRGSCGGLGQSTDGTDPPSCSLCSDPDEACRELKGRMRASQAENPEERQGAT